MPYGNVILPANSEYYSMNSIIINGEEIWKIIMK